MWLTLPLIVLCGLFVGPSARAQTQNGEIKGVVTDPAGSRIPKAAVTATNQSTQIYRTVESSDTGDYVISNLQPGVYRVAVTKQGFQKGLTQDVTLDVNQIVTLDIQLRVGAMNETTVSVAAEGALLEAATAQLGTVITEEKIVDLPLNARNFSELVTLTPGATPVSVGENNSPLFVAKVGQSYFPAINGQTNRSNTFTLDGIYNNGNYGGTYAIAPNVDALSEFKVQSHSDQAEFGGVTGGIVNLITKSGTNQFHGTAYEFLRNDALDARGFFTAKKPPLRQNQFGATVGGPIRKNNTFFFFSYEGYRQRNPISALTVVPTPATIERRFQCAELRQIFNPFSTRVNPANANTYLRDPFPNNMIPSSLLNPSMQAWAKAVIPAPISTGFANFNQRNGDPQSFPSNQYNLRGDHQISQTDSIWMRYIRGQQNQRSANALPGTYSLTDLPDSNAGAGYTHIFGTNTVLTALFGYSSMRQITAPFVSSQNLIGQGLFPGLPAINAPGMGSLLPARSEPSPAILATVVPRKDTRQAPTCRTTSTAIV